MKINVLLRLRKRLLSLRRRILITFRLFLLSHQLSYNKFPATTFATRSNTMANCFSSRLNRKLINHVFEITFGNCFRLKTFARKWGGATHFYLEMEDWFGISRELTCFLGVESAYGHVWFHFYFKFIIIYYFKIKLFK